MGEQCWGRLKTSESYRRSGTFRKFEITEYIACGGRRTMEYSSEMGTNGPREAILLATR